MTMNAPMCQPGDRALKSVNWDFPDRVVHSEIEGIHPYPAKFIAEIPRALIQALPVSPGTAVLDPFCGSGATLVECQRQGVASLGIDINPIACLMSRVKTAPLPSGLGQAARAVADAAERAGGAPVPSIQNLDHWFQKDIQQRLAALISAIRRAPPETRNALCLAFSSIIVRVSNQESDTRYAAIRKGVGARDVWPLFLRAVARIEDALAGRTYSLAPACVVEGDTLQVKAHDIGQPIGLVITSPPYPNAYEYWLYHKYRMWWLGFDPLAVKEREIGARAHFFKTNHHTADDFIRQMDQTFALLADVCVRDAHACFVVGRSRIHGKIVDNAEIIQDAGRRAGFYQVFRTERVLAAHRKSFNLAHANIKTETVIVLKKDPR